ncbi:DUF6311 domain-containing protein [Candidatus Saccharibacteria bacterium]|nr:DUF6311 domain-containing protein [Candidatus Saccharibacteria bacterium]MCL1962808.1 DUF6311 domain-containing protein [Candidatus Saccharibacteria bacterium]
MKILKFLGSTKGAFLLGGLLGALFFGAFFGFAVVNPGYTDWIFYSVTHDTAQHFLGWEFFRADSTGAIINGLAYPVGLPITFMDGIPLVALPLKLIAGWLPANFQYFGIWALICYILQGGIAAVLVRKVWLKIKSQDEEKIAGDFVKQILFIIAGALILVVSPIMIARTLYHPALAAQWLILLGILLVWDAKKIAKPLRFITVWSAMLVGAVLIHPYFLPMLGVMMVIAGLRNHKSKTVILSERSESKNLRKKTKDSSTMLGMTKYLIQIAIPVVLAGVIFILIGGFALGSGAEIRDLHEKSFNLLSFANPGGYSIIPGFPNASGSMETLMWFGLGVWVMLIVAAILWRGRYKKSFQEFRTKFAMNKLRNVLIAVTAFGLLVFAIGVRIDVGPIAIFQWQPPDKIYEFWLAFRAIAREAWAFYYAAILAIIYWFGKAILSSRAKRGDPDRLLRFARNNICIVAILLCIIASIQFIDIWWGPAATTRREGFAKIQNTTTREFIAPEIADLVTTQKHLIVLNKWFRYDINGFSELAQAALKHNLTINVGFFARVPEQAFAEQKTWRDKFENGKLSVDDFNENLFVTTDKIWAEKIAESNYQIEKRGKFYFIIREEK